MNVETELRAGRIAGELAEEFPELAVTYCELAAPDRGFQARSTRAVRDRLHTLADRYTGGRAVNLRKEEIPAAYRVFSRQIGVDPDSFPTPPETLMLRRMRDGEFRSRGRLADALTIAAAETSIALMALDADAVEGRLGLRLAGSNETLGGTEEGFPLVDRQIVVADDRRALAILFGQIAEDCEPDKQSTRALVVAISVKGVSAVSLGECLWTVQSALQS